MLLKLKPTYPKCPITISILDGIQDFRKLKHLGQVTLICSKSILQSFQFNIRNESATS